jgi:hypothetical protein
MAQDVAMYLLASSAIVAGLEAARSQRLRRMAAQQMAGHDVAYVVNGMEIAATLT